MKNFRRAILDSLHHWPMLVLATLCSICVAALWSGNIGAMYPVIQMTLEGRSVQSKVAESIASTEAELDKQDIREKELTALLAAGLSDADKVKAEQELTQLGKQQARTEQLLLWQQWELRLAKSILPTDPFSTICFIMGILVFSTLVKHLLILANDMLIGRVSTTIVRSFAPKIVLIRPWPMTAGRIKPTGPVRFWPRLRILQTCSATV